MRNLFFGDLIQPLSVLLDGDAREGAAHVVKLGRLREATNQHMLNHVLQLSRKKTHSTTSEFGFDFLP